MTPEERPRPELIKGSRRLRIARGSGTNVQQVNRLVKQFDQMRKVMSRSAAERCRRTSAALMRRRPLRGGAAAPADHPDPLRALLIATV